MAPTVLADRYVLAHRLGEGGMARVWRATDRTLDRPVAVKILADRFARDPEFIERFRREARAAAALNHPAVVAVYDTGEDGGRHFIVMELVEGETLADLLRREERILPGRAAEIAAAVCAGLDAAHGAGLVHRDVKPGNIMLDREGRVKVADFGIARAETAETLTGSRVLGTAAYLSPEQAAGRPVDPRSDLYSLGCVLHQMLAGIPPFAGDTPVAVAAKHVREPPPELPPSVPAELRSVVERALAKDPDDRYPDARRMGDALRGAGRIEATVPQAASGDTSVLESVPPEPPDRRRWRRMAAAALGLALLGGVLAFAAFGGGDAPAERRADRRPAQAPSSPEPPPAEDKPPSLQEAARALSTILGEAVASESVERKLAEEIAKKANEALDRHSEGKLEEALKKVEEAREKLAEGLEKEEVRPDAAADLDAALGAFAAALERTSPSPTEIGTGEDDGGGPGGEGPPGQEKKSDDDD